MNSMSDRGDSVEALQSVFFGNLRQKIYKYSTAHEAFPSGGVPRFDDEQLLLVS